MIFNFCIVYFIFLMLGGRRWENGVVEILGFYQNRGLFYCYCFGFDVLFNQFYNLFFYFEVFILQFNFGFSFQRLFVWGYKFLGQELMEVFYRKMLSFFQELGIWYIKFRCDFLDYISGQGQIFWNICYIMVNYFGVIRFSRVMLDRIFVLIYFFVLLD